MSRSSTAGSSAGNRKRSGGGVSQNVEPIDLTHHFLIAMPSMVDPNFARTLIFVCEHNAQGALGIIINRPIEMNLEALFQRIDIPLAAQHLGSLPVYFGGPVQTDRGFVLHHPIGSWQSTLQVRDQLGLTSSRDILQSVGAAGEPTEFLITLGYAGWSAGQLDDEFSQNAWLSVAADPDIIFKLAPEQRLPAAMRLLGFDILNLSDVAGHA